ncbi:MAG: 3-methyl-2-oxobutanoate hydroxymethyltransferase [Nitrospinae bacterium]|nr:3-methyl-2-oxobutanoate hydroxymethyltransferase [Nitrospinota bacterium]
MSAGKVTVTQLKQMKEAGEKITAVAVFDYGFGKLADMAGVDVALVGDSLGMTFRGEENTLTVTVDEMAYHTKAVRRGVSRALLVGDMPFLSCHLGVEETLKNAGKLVAAGAEAVKVEGGGKMIAVVEALVSAGIPVMGHLGLTPQSIHQLGGYKIQGRGKEKALRMMEEAQALAAAGVFSLVLECVPAQLAEEITRAIPAPTIGIGAGPACDGQILVAYDLLGMPSKVTPKFVKKYADLAGVASHAMGEYIAETKHGVFPGEEHSYTTQPRHLKAI